MVGRFRCGSWWSILLAEETMKNFLFHPIAVLLICCGSPPGPTPPIGGHLDPRDCTAACETLERLDCRTKRGTSYTKIVPGKSCEDGCKQKIEEGVDMHPTCVSAAVTCEAVDHCSRR